MKRALTAAAILLIAGPAMAAPGDPRTLRGNLEWPATLSAEPFVVVRSDDGRFYYADVSRARRMSAEAIAGAVSLVGVEGSRPHEIAAVVVGAGDSALSFATPTVPTPAEIGPAPASLPRQAATQPPPALAPSTPPPAAPLDPVVPGPATGEDIWRIAGRVMAVTAREFLIETHPGETVRVDVSKLSSWTRDSVRAGDRVKLFGIPQQDSRLVANGFIQEVPASRDASR